MFKGTEPRHNPNVHKNTTMAPRKEGKFTCGHKNSDLPTGQPASYQLLGRSYYAHRCKSCTAEDCRRSVDEMHSNYHDERLRLLRARRISKTLLAENQFNTTTDMGAQQTFHERPNTAHCRQENAIKAQTLPGIQRPQGPHHGLD